MDKCKCGDGKKQSRIVQIIPPGDYEAVIRGTEEGTFFRGPLACWGLRDNGQIVGHTICRDGVVLQECGGENFVGYLRKSDVMPAEWENEKKNATAAEVNHE